MNYSLNRLLKARLPIDWISTYVGLKYRWIRAEEVLNLIYNDLLKGADDNLVVDLELMKDNHKEFFSKVSQYVLSIFQDGFQDKVVRAERIWNIAFLIDIVTCESSIEDKLQRVSVLWADLNYPEAWKNFIYYMPDESSNELRNKQFVFNKLNAFIEKEKLELLDQG